MFVDLISFKTADGVTLDAIFCPPAPGEKTPTGPVDAVLLVHGSGGNFYRHSTKAMAADLSAQGYPCLAINTKGHDTVWLNLADGQYYGNANEILDNSRLDLKAGVDQLWERGYRRIALLGHSMGAVKVAYYAATEQDRRISTVIPVSPVRLSYTYYMESEASEEFQANMQRADEMEAEDRALDLMAVRFPIPQMFSAASYLDKHGPAERYNLVTLAPRIAVPLFVIAGELETHVRLRDCARDIVTAAINSPRAEYVIIPGGDHALNNNTAAASAAVLRWLGELSLETATV